MATDGFLILAPFIAIQTWRISATVVRISIVPLFSVCGANTQENIGRCPVFLPAKNAFS